MAAAVIAAAAAKVDFDSFPLLRLDPNNVSVSWENWKTKFNLKIELATLKMGVDADAAPLFTGRTKLLALLTAIGNDGIDTLTSLGFDISSRENDSFTTALNLLNDTYGQEDSFFRI